jgi:hypothetical protein
MARILVWDDASISECPGCGGTVAVGIMSLCASCDYCGFYYVPGYALASKFKPEDRRNCWYSSRQAFERGDPAL